MSVGGEVQLCTSKAWVFQPILPNLTFASVTAFTPCTLSHNIRPFRNISINRRRDADFGAHLLQRRPSPAEPLGSKTCCPSHDNQLNGFVSCFRHTSCVRRLSLEVSAQGAHTELPRGASCQAHATHPLRVFRDASCWSHAKHLLRVFRHASCWAGSRNTLPGSRHAPCRASGETLPVANAVSAPKQGLAKPLLCKALGGNRSSTRKPEQSVREPERSVQEPEQSDEEPRVRVGEPLPSDSEDRPRLNRKTSAPESEDIHARIGGAAAPDRENADVANLQASIRFPHMHPRRRWTTV